MKAVDTHEAVAVGPSGFAVYTFQGETTHHIICKKTNEHQAPTAGRSGRRCRRRRRRGQQGSPGINGKLGTFKNHGVTQLTLNGQPLYYFTPDILAKNKHQATGDELKTFGSIWHIVKASGASSAVDPAGADPDDVDLDEPVPAGLLIASRRAPSSAWGPPPYTS